MSTQSILLKDKAHYAKEFEKQILWNADRYYMHRFYRLGEDMNFNEAMYYSKMGSFICTKNCELIDWIKNKLEGKLENCGKKTKEKSIYDLIKMIPQNGGSMTDNFNSIMHWEDAVW